MRLRLRIDLKELIIEFMRNIFRINDSGVISVNLESEYLYPTYYDFFDTFDYEGNGYCWESHIILILEALDLELLNHLTFDSEAGSIAIHSKTIDFLNRFADLLNPIFGDLEKLRYWVSKADPVRIDD